MTSEERRDWLHNLNPGDEVQVIHSDGSVRGGVVVLEPEPRISWTYLAVDCGFRNPIHFHKSSVGDIGGREGFPHGMPMIIGDVSYIFPREEDPQDCIDRLNLRRKMSNHRNFINLHITTVRKLLAVLSEAEEGKERE